MSEIIPKIEFIFDRTAADVENDTPKGQYNYYDLSRVEIAVETIAAMMRQLGYTKINPVVKTDWHAPTDLPESFDTPTTQQMQRYLDNVRLIRGAFEVFETTPNVPSDMRFLTYIEANNIEKVLSDVYVLTENLQKQVKFSGMFYAGEE